MLSSLFVLPGYSHRLLQDRPAQETIAQITEWLKKRPPQTYHPHRTCLCGRNDGKLASTAPALLDASRRAQAGGRTGQPQYLHVFGGYNWHTGQVSCVTATHKNRDTFVAFLEQLLAEYPRQKLIVVMDNASYHHSQTTHAALSLYEDRLIVIWLPKYSPFLNPIERFWLHFKQLAVANHLHRSLKALQDSVDEVMQQQNTWHHPNRLRLFDMFRLVA